MVQKTPEEHLCLESHAVSDSRLGQIRGTDQSAREKFVTSLNGLAQDKPLLEEQRQHFLDEIN